MRLAAGGHLVSGGLGGGVGDSEDPSLLVRIHCAEVLRFATYL